MTPTHIRAYASSGNVVAFLDLVDGAATFTAAEDVVRVVFYSGDLADEVVVEAWPIWAPAAL